MLAILQIGCVHIGTTSGKKIPHSSYGHNPHPHILTGTESSQDAKVHSVIALVWYASHLLVFGPYSGCSR
jgi:hypothetical protein